MVYRPLDSEGKRNLIRQIALLIHNHDTFTFTIQHETKQLVPFRIGDPCGVKPTGEKNISFEFTCVPKRVRRKLEQTTDVSWQP